MHVGTKHMRRGRDSLDALRVLIGGRRMQAHVFGPRLPWVTIGLGKQQRVLRRLYGRPAKSANDRRRNAVEGRPRKEGSKSRQPSAADDTYMLATTTTTTTSMWSPLRRCGAHTRGLRAPPCLPVLGGSRPEDQGWRPPHPQVLCTTSLFDDANRATSCQERNPPGYTRPGHSGYRASASEPASAAGGTATHAVAVGIVPHNPYMFLLHRLLRHASDTTLIGSCAVLRACVSGSLSSRASCAHLVTSTSTVGIETPSNHTSTTGKHGWTNAC